MPLTVQPQHGGSAEVKEEMRGLVLHVQLTEVGERPAVQTRIVLL
jgi:hypothetical protein